MSTTLSTFSGGLKQMYAPNSKAFVEILNTTAPFWASIKKASEGMSADGTFNPVVMQNDETGGAINPGETFEVPDYMLPIKPKILPKLMVYPFTIDGSVIRLTRTDKQAFGKALDQIMKNRVLVGTSDLNRQAQGTGTGQITLANGAGTATANLVVDDWTPFRPGMHLDIFQTIGGTKEVSNAIVASVDPATSTVVLTAPATWSDNAIVCKRGKMDGVTSSANAKEMMGLQGIIDTTTFSTVFEGVDRTVYPQFQGNVIDAGGALVSHDFLQRCLNRTAMVGGLEPTTLRTNYGQARNFMDTELQKTRYEPGVIDAGVTTLKWGKYTWDVDHTCPLFQVFFLNKAYFEKFQVEDLSLSDLPGYTLYQMQGTDSIGGYYVYNGNLGSWKPNAHAKGINLLEPTF